MNDLLFVCQENRLRSPTCEHVARLMGYAADSAGTAETAIRPLTDQMLASAATVICMTESQANYVRQMGSPWLDFRRVHVWGIPDIYDYCQPELMALVRERLAKYPKGQA